MSSEGNLGPFANAPEFLWNSSAVVLSGPPLLLPPPSLVSVQHQEPGAGLGAGLRGAAALPVDSHIKSYSQPRTQSYRQRESSSVCGILMRREEGGGGQTLKDTVGGSLPDPPRSLDPSPGHEDRSSHGRSPPLLPLPEDGDRVRHCGSLGVVPG